MRRHAGHEEEESDLLFGPKSTPCRVSLCVHLGNFAPLKLLRPKEKFAWLPPLSGATIVCCTANSSSQRLGDAVFLLCCVMLCWILSS